MMNSPFYLRTRAKQQNNMAMQEETSVMSIPRIFRNKSPIDLEKEVETYSPRQQEENDIAQEIFEKDSSYNDTAAPSLMKTTQDFENEINLGRIRALTDQLEISKILEKQLKEENKTNKKEKAKLVKENEKLNEELGRLKRKNDLLSKQAFKWLRKRICGRQNMKNKRSKKHCSGKIMTHF